MRIKDILSPDSMIMELKAKNKEDAIKEMADLEVATDIVNDEDAFIKSIWARENESTTGIGGGIAMHVTNLLTRHAYYSPRVRKELTIIHLMVNQFTYSS